MESILIKSLYEYVSNLISLVAKLHTYTYSDFIIPQIRILCVLKWEGKHTDITNSFLKCQIEYIYWKILYQQPVYLSLKTELAYAPSSFFVAMSPKYGFGELLFTKVRVTSF